jgi:hypothetical protein
MILVLMLIRPGGGLCRHSRAYLAHSENVMSVKAINDGLAVKKFAQEVASGARKIDQNITLKFLHFIQALSAQHKPDSIVAILNEAPSKFTKEERKADPTAYQYTLRMKVIWGAAHFCKMEVSGSINQVYKDAQEALEKKGVAWDGTSIESINQKREKDKRAKLAAEALAKHQANGLEGNNLYKAVADDVNQSLANETTESNRKAAARYVASIIKANNNDLTAAVDYINLLVEEVNRIIAETQAEADKAQAKAKPDTAMAQAMDKAQQEPANA